ncbi:hypothetical protein DFH27DRAFT_553699 [Peziza echinospora]|nr:hypothetical protein DFH27DRAFT_553699 [Peziza echinospora]
MQAAAAEARVHFSRANRRVCFVSARNGRMEIKVFGHGVGYVDDRIDDRVRHLECGFCFFFLGFFLYGMGIPIATTQAHRRGLGFPVFCVFFFAIGLVKHFE